MKRFLKTLKICLTAISLSACDQMPEFPDIHPSLIIPSQGKKFDCRVISKKPIRFECDEKSTAIGDLDGFIAIPAEEVSLIVRRSNEALEYVDKNCNKQVKSEYGVRTLR